MTTGEASITTFPCLRELEGVYFSSYGYCGRVKKESSGRLFAHWGIAEQELSPTRLWIAEIRYPKFELLFPSSPTPKLPGLQGATRVCIEEGRQEEGPKCPRSPLGQQIQYIMNP